MALESPTYISDLNTSNPAASDPKNQGDDHLRNIKTAIKNSFTNITGAMTATHTELNYAVGVTSALAGVTDSATLTNKTINLTSNTLTGTLAQFSTACSDQDLASVTLQQNSQSAPYTLVLADAGKHILHPSADTAARTFTIPANASVAYPVGTGITFINQNGAGLLSIAITSDTMRLAGPGTTGTRTLTANGIATAVKVTSTEWIISGVNLA